MNAPVSRLLRQLEARIASASSRLSQDCLLAERACYRARQGFLAEAEETINVLRKRYQSDPKDVLSARINLAEGLLRHFRDMHSLSREKFHRAYALSEISENNDLIALTAAWLAHVEYLCGDFELMAKHLHRSIQTSSPTNHAALSRSSLVAADAFHLAGRLDLAQPWYTKARVHANTEGDDATTSAFLHNMAWLRAANLRQTQFCGLAQSPGGEHALISANSVLHFDQIVGTNSLNSLVPILQAQILSLLGESEQALRLYEEHLDLAVREGLNRMHSSLLADQAWCRLQTGDIEAAIRDAVAAQDLMDPKAHPDDRASSHSRLSQVFGATGNLESQKRHAELAEEAWKMHSTMQHTILNCLASLPSELSVR